MTTPALSDQSIIDGLLAREGGYVNDPADPGGPTKFGITAASLGAWRKLGRSASAEEVEALGEAEARAIYRARYVEGPGFDALGNQDLRTVVVDCGVLHGPRNAVRMLQRALGTTADGKLGPVTLTAANAWNGTKLALLVSLDRLKFLGRHISGDLTDADRDGIPDATEFAAGWINRVCDMMEALIRR